MAISMPPAESKISSSLTVGTSKRLYCHIVGRWRAPSTSHGKERSTYTNTVTLLVYRTDALDPTDQT
jgi:hypothetical protein